jgi:hypothetical protein
MKLDKLLIAAVLLGGLSGLVWWSNKREKANEGKPPADASPKILTLNEGSISQIEIKHRDGEPTVLKKDDTNHWSITAPKPLAADQAAVAKSEFGSRRR